METYYSNIARRWALTLLDFIWKKEGTLYNFPTLIFYQIGYSLFTVWQASYRAYRLVQKEECRNYYMAYENSIQMEVISLIAEKQIATSAIQGKFSTEGISTMAKGVDVKVRLAAALANSDFETSSSIQDMFDILSESNKDDGSYDGFEQMKILREWIGEELEQELMREFKAEFDFDAFLDEMLLEMEEDPECNLSQNAADPFTEEKDEKTKVVTRRVMDVFSLFE